MRCGIPWPPDGRLALACPRRDGHVLEVTINRPDQRNSLTPPANDELDEVFDAFLADPDLWVAILTGAGDKAFSAGNDLLWSASGKPMWVPPTASAVSPAAARCPSRSSQRSTGSQWEAGRRSR